MPTISVFIRKDDVEAWRALENKSEWLHTKLQQEVKLNEYMGKVRETDPRNTIANKPIPKPYKRNHDMSMDVEDQTRVDDDPDWGA